MIKGLICECNNKIQIPRIEFKNGQYTAYCIHCGKYQKNLSGKERSYWGLKAYKVQQAVNNWKTRKDRLDKIKKKEKNLKRKINREDNKKLLAQQKRYEKYFDLEKYR